MKQTIPILIFLGLILTGCDAFQSGADKGIEGPKVFLAAEWNVQALFDGEENGNEYGEYLEKAGWTAEKYRARLNAVSQAILKNTDWKSYGPMSHASPPELLGLVELENSGVLEELAGGTFSEYGYLWTAFAGIPGSSLGIGFLSRFPFKETRVHSITVGNETAPRPILEVRVEPEGKPLVFLLCHWKSKLGGDETTEYLRRASARVIQRRLRELRASDPEVPVIVMGDLNENHDEYTRSSALCALLPDNPDAAAAAAKAGAGNDFLVISGKKPPKASFFPEHTETLYSPWEDELKGGSYFYRGEWETIDHFLLSDRLFDGCGWDYADCIVLSQAPFTKANGTPNAYVPRNGNGLSDHLPLLLYLYDTEGN